MSDQPVLSVVVPAYNEVLRLSGTVVEIVEFLRAGDIGFELIVSDDGSTDGTANLVGELANAYSEIKTVRSERNRGKGHAVKLGLNEAVGRRVLFCDADGATPIDQLVPLQTALDDGLDIAVGSRALDGVEVQRSTKLHRRVMGRIFSHFVTARLAPGIADTQCGFKLFTQDAAAAVGAGLTVPGFGFDMEIFVIARSLGLDVREVPVSWHDVPGSKVELINDSLRMVGDAVRVYRRDRAGGYVTAG